MFSSLFRILKYVLGIAATATIGYLLYINLNTSPCDQPLTYRIGTFDTKFGISKEDFIATLESSESIWEKPAGKNLFAYSPNGKIPVNLVYDDRQALTDRNKILTNKIEETKMSADAVQVEFQNLKNIFSQKNAEFTALQNSFTARLNTYNTNVEYWNTRGGAPENEYKKLATEKDTLATLRTELEQKYQDANAVAGQINALIDKYNLLVDHANTDVRTVNSTAGQEFSEGEYIEDTHGARINVYQFETKEKLRRVLAHEFGHALGLDHNDNPKSIMYKLNQSSNIIPTSEDMAALRIICKLQ